MRSVVSPAPREEWRAVIAGDPLALPEHAPEWLDAICEAGPYADASRYYVDDLGRHFVLPMVRKTGVTGAGGWLYSYPPAWGMGGLIGAGADAAVHAEVLEDLWSLGAQRVAVRPDPLRSPLWSDQASASTIRIPRRGHVLDLTPGPVELLASMSQSTRRAFRQAERNGVQIKVDRSGELLEQYYELFLLSVDRWARHQNEPLALARRRAQRRDPLSKLRSMSQHLGKSFMITMAYIGGEPVLGTIVLLGQTAHYTRGAMDIEKVRSSHAGELAMWTAIQLACEQGCTKFHLGESGESATLARFKERFGAVPVDYVELRLERLPVTQADRKLRSVVKKAIRFRDT